jgi:hypothetical protein
MRYIYLTAIGFLLLWAFGCSDHMPVGPQYEEILKSGEIIAISSLAGEPLMPNLIRVGHVDFSGGQVAARDIIEVNEDLPGTFEFIDRAIFNSMSVEELRATYDVLIFPWRGSTLVDADWETRLLPFMELGGGIVWEDELNVGDLYPAVTGIGGLFSGSGMYISDEVPILTDGLTNTLGNGMIRFTDFDEPPFSPFISRNNGTNVETVGLWGKFGKGTIVLTGVLANYYGNKNGVSWQQNYYNLALNALLFVASEGGNVEEIYPVDITLRPGSSHNPVSINLQARGVLPVAILSSSGFDAREVDRSSVRFGATGEEESLATLGNGRSQCGEEDVNGNGLTDLVCHFWIQRTDFDYNSTEGILTGSMLNGMRFRGSVEINIQHNELDN